MRNDKFFRQLRHCSSSELQDLTFPAPLLQNLIASNNLTMQITKKEGEE